MQHLCCDTLVDMYVMCERLEEARAVFDKLPSEHVVRDAIRICSAMC